MGTDIVVLDVQKDNSGIEFCKYVFISEENGYSVIPNSGNIIRLSDLGRLVISNNLKPLNFSVDRNCEVKQDCGSFSRFNKGGTAIVIAEYKNTAGRTLGYKLISSTSGCTFKLKTADLVAQEKKLKRPIMQNAIVRNDCVNCYPLHKFPVIVVGDKKAQRNAENKISSHLSKKKTIEKPTFSKEQLKEINACKKKGIDSSIIENPSLSPEQMRVIWVSKSNGALSEYFAKPCYSVDIMKFYGDRLVSPLAVKECSLMLSKPDLTLGQLTQLYLCIGDGVDYSDLCNLSEDEIYSARLDRNMFDSSFNLNADEDALVDKCMDYLMKEKGYI